MADIPSIEQKLNTDICLTQPDNTEIWLNEYYCILGYRPNEQVGSQGDRDYAAARTYCVEVPVPLPPATTEAELAAEGIGNKRYFFDTAAIDKQFHEAEFKNAFTTTTPWESTMTPKVGDMLRATTGLFWTWNTARNKIIYLNNPVGITSTAEVRDTDRLSPFKLKVTDTGAGTTGSRTATITLEPSDDATVSSFWPTGSTAKEEKFKPLAEEAILQGTYFYDHTFELTLPTLELNEIDVGSGLVHYSVKPVYNYHVPQYEHVLKSEIKESELPNLYNILSIADGNDSTNSEKHAAYLVKDAADFATTYARAATASGMKTKLINDFNTDYNTWANSQITQGHQTLRAGDSLQYDSGVGVMRNYEYFEAAAKQYAGVTGTMPWANQYKNVLMVHGTAASITGDNIKKLQAYNTKKDAFPMYMDIEFSTPSYNPSPESFTETLKDTRLSCHMMKDIAKGTTGAFGLSAKQYMEFLESSGVYTDDTGTTPKQRRALNIEAWFDGLVTLNEASEILDTGGDFIFLGEGCTAAGGLSIAGHLLELDSAIGSILTANDRTFKEMLEGKKAATEIVLYRIAKKDTNGNLIQNFFLPSSESVDTHKFIDTQIKYGKEYTYEVQAWVLVYGMKYQYNTRSITGPTATANVTYEQDTKLIEVPYFEYTNKALDAPPVSPKVDIIPYYGVNNKLMISLESGTEKIKKKPEIIEEGEALDIANFLKSQNSTTQMLTYKTDDFIFKYKIYRLDFHPESYADFANGMIRDIEDLEGSSILIDETILPNKKYWYIFRSIDKHEHLSYPSSIYQIELVDDGASIYPLIDVVEFTVPDHKAPSKLLKKIMHIMPALGHRLLPIEKESTLRESGTEGIASGDFKLGITRIKKETLWGKKFKIRLTSKKTGRKIDLNVEFKNEHIPN